MVTARIWECSMVKYPNFLYLVAINETQLQHSGLPPPREWHRTDYISYPRKRESSLPKAASNRKHFLLSFIQSHVILWLLFMISRCSRKLRAITYWTGKLQIYQASSGTWIRNYYNTFTNSGIIPKNQTFTFGTINAPVLLTWQTVTFSIMMNS